MLTRDQIISEIKQMFERKGISSEVNHSTKLRDIGFRSLDFSELAIRIENKINKELNFDAEYLRNIEIIEDVISFFEKAQK